MTSDIVRADIDKDEQCPNCRTFDVKFHTRQYDCRTCRPLGAFRFGTDIDRNDHRHWQCANGHRWADPR